MLGRTKIKLIAALSCGVVALAPTAAVAAAGSGAGAATSAQAAPQAPADPHPPYRAEFFVPGVIIWSAPDGQSTRLGLGYPGQGFAVDDNADGSNYTCDLTSTTFWLHGQDIATGVVGWVPSCNLNLAG
ncbi:hypothetical protein [Kitasatospora sp. MAP5-34]|uniref:hypothetical protein n=1 Tax=Kitasatospora sp. MAP5-34 TaxID=3035102 RepID=UPI002476CB56|nr:hypothetical protein [Kitasatospora sp. MAP5-34]MDH6577300.1 hypothetical protein [Kitasatospora sp. MAP5-34]